MHAIWRGKERIVLIDKWDGSKIMGSRIQLEHYIQTLSRGEIEFLEIISNCSCIGDMTSDFIDPDVHKPKYAKNGNLLLVTSGMKIASGIRDEIYEFLKS